MWHDFVAESSFCEGLEAIDEAIAARVREAGCTRCRGPLYRADYPRKPRGGGIGDLGERWTRRISLCCGAEGCRRRSTPPSVRFLGRRVYVGVAVTLAPARVQEGASAPTEVPARTLRRWLAWWRDGLRSTRWWLTLVGLIPVGQSTAAQPAGILAVVRGDRDERVRRILRLLSPLTTSSVDGATFLREAT